ncbi:anti-sigma factor [Nocardia sp. NBC_01730]|uniref:anti-sigma factor n=1 Tax=Nocardia sp. NBC_01730 TaxID=2975998 RepID=UPI002E149FE8|nr:anti-sigma factor [Nocardia sp. NBC_01730]
MVIRARAVHGALGADGVTGTANTPDMVHGDDKSMQDRALADSRTRGELSAEGRDELDSTRIMPPLDVLGRAGILPQPDALGHTHILPPLELFRDDDTAPLPARHPWATQVVIGTATAVAVALVTIAGYALVGRAANGDATVATEQVRSAADTVTRKGTVVTEGGSATALVSHSAGKMVVSAVGLPTLDREHGYQLWLIPTAGAPRSAGMMHTAGGRTEQVADLRDDTAFVVITTEPTDGSLQPTTPIAVRIDLA